MSFSAFRVEQRSRRSQSKGNADRAGGEGAEDPLPQAPSGSSPLQPPTKPLCQPQIPTSLCFPLQWLLPRTPSSRKLPPSPRSSKKTAASSSAPHHLRPAFQPHVNGEQQCSEVAPELLSRSKNAPDPRDAKFSPVGAPFFAAASFVTHGHGRRWKRVPLRQSSSSRCHRGKLSHLVPLPLSLCPQHELLVSSSALPPPFGVALLAL